MLKLKLNKILFPVSTWVVEHLLLNLQIWRVHELFGCKCLNFTVLKGVCEYMNYELS